MGSILTTHGAPPHLQKTKIPARGLKQHTRSSAQHCSADAQLQKTKIPARGLKSVGYSIPKALSTAALQKTKIPARGLKPGAGSTLLHPHSSAPSKNQNPREGIETYTRCCDSLFFLCFKKPKSPRGD